ncbi:hypothetical protein ACJQWK_00023 [Exserohilum turcicum]
MPTQSQSLIIPSKPIGKGLDGFRNYFRSICEDIGVSNSSQALDHVDYEESQNLLVSLLSALQALPAARILQCRNGSGTLFEGLLKLNALVSFDNFDVERIRPLLDAIINNQSDEVIWAKVDEAVTKSTPPPPPPSLSVQQTLLSINTGSFANSSEHRKYVDNILKEELGHLYVGIPGFFDAFLGDVPELGTAAQVVFDTCKEGHSPLYRVESGWQGWPEGAKEKDVLNWFALLLDQFQHIAYERLAIPQSPRRPLAQPHKPLQGSTATRKLDIGFVDDPDAGVDSRCRWSQILIPGELKSNPSADKASKAWLDLGRYAQEVFATQDSRRFVLGFTLCGPFMRLWVFDRLGGIASKQFNVNKDGLQFVSVMLGLLWMNKAQLGFDPTIVTIGDKRYIQIERENGKERLIINKVIKRVPCVAGRATTCWKVTREEDPDTPLVVKDSWQYPERDEEGEMLHEATEKGVVNVARYFHHQTVRVGNQDDDICANVRKGLDITKATNYMPQRQMPLLNNTGRRASRRDGSSNVAGRKRPSSSINTPLPPSKRLRSSSPEKPAIVNRVHRRVIVRDYGEAIYKSSSPAMLLTALEQCIHGYESLHTQGGILQRDISPNNLMVNEDAGNPSSWRAFLVDLDLAIKERREMSSGACAKTGTRPFMAIGLLLDEQHSFMHDLESFFWVLFWVCVHYDGPGKDIGPTEFECWNYESSKKLAELKKGLISDESDFLKTVEASFTTYYKPLAFHVNELRKKVFPGGERWRVANCNLYSEMKTTLRAARDALNYSVVKV